MNFSNTGVFHDSPHYLSGLNHQNSTVPTIIEDITNECLSDNEFEGSHEQEECDMFFSCADWETQIKQSQPTEETDQGFQTPCNKRLFKFMDKFANTDVRETTCTEFDVDLVMNKNIASTSKVLSKRSRPVSKPRQVSPKKALRVSTLKQDTCQERDNAPFQDLCLSPMGLRIAGDCKSLSK